MKHRRSVIQTLGLWALKAGTRAAKWTGLHPSQGEYWVNKYFGGEDTTAAGVVITEETALTLTAVQNAIWQISTSASILPLGVYRRLAGGGREPVPLHPAHARLNVTANDDMTATMWRRSLVANALGWGNGYSEIVNSSAGVLQAINHIEAKRVTPTRQDGALQYDVRDQAGVKTAHLMPDQIIHLPGFSFNGITGVSPIRAHAQALGLGMAAQQFAASFFGQGSRPVGALQTDNKLDKPARENLRESYNDTHKGNFHGVLVLEQGLKWQQIGINPVDAQLLELMKLSVTDVARIFNIPPHMLKDLDRATFSNIESQNIQYVVMTLLPWLVALEQELTRKLIRADERDVYYIEHNVNGLLRGDIDSRSRAYEIGLRNGWLNRDEVRAMENWNPIPGGAGKKYLVQLNQTTLEKIGEDPPKQDPPPPPPPAGDDDDGDDNPDGDDDAARFAPVFEDAARRMMARASGSLRKAVAGLANTGDIDRFAAWTADFLRRHRRDVNDILDAPVTSMTGVSGDRRCLLLSGLAARHTDDLGRGIADAAATDDAPTALSILANQWQRNAGAELAREIMTLLTA